MKFDYDRKDRLVTEGMENAVKQWTSINGDGRVGFNLNSSNARLVVR